MAELRVGRVFSITVKAVMQTFSPWFSGLRYHVLL